MKKSVIIITAVIYLLSIVVVAFLGYAAEIKNPPIYAEDIIMVLDDAENFPEEKYTFYYNGAAIYDVTLNPEWHKEESSETSSQESTESQEELLNDESTSSETQQDIEVYKYRIKFYGSEEFEYYQQNLKTLDLHVEAYSSRGEVENPSLSYYVDKDKADILTVDKKGVVTFNKAQEFGDYEVRVSTNDGSKKVIYVNIYW